MGPPKTTITVDDGDGDKSKLAWVKALAPYAVALLSLVGIALGVWAQVKTGNTNDALKTTVEQLNTQTIPMLNTLLKEQREETRKIREKLSTACERLAYLEAFTKSLGTKARVKPPPETSRGGSTFGYGTGVAHVTMGPPEPEPEKPDKSAAKKLEELIPRLEVQQLARPE
jgi:uncharacterized coiled-coil protein SlyX